MKPLPQVLLTLVLVLAALWIYDTLREGPVRRDDTAFDDAALTSRLEAVEAGMRRVEDRLSALRAGPPAKETPTPKGPLSAAELDKLESVVREIERRRELERLRNAAGARLKALGVELTDAQRQKTIQLIVGFEAERADFWRQVQHEGLQDKDEIGRRFAPIRERYEASLRHALPEDKARPVIKAVLGS